MMNFLYNCYVLGGVEVLYEHLIEKSNDYIANLYDFLEDFENRYNDDLDIDRFLKWHAKRHFKGFYYE